VAKRLGPLRPTRSLRRGRIVKNTGDGFCRFYREFCLQSDGLTSDAERVGDRKGEAEPSAAVHPPYIQYGTPTRINVARICQRPASSPLLKIQTHRQDPVPVKARHARRRQQLVSQANV
jgi:hypothetical protein